VFLSRLAFGLCAGLFVSNAIHAKDLSTSQRLNGANTRKAFAKTKQAAFASTVRLIRNGKLITHGTIVSKEGLLLTKASACVGAREAVLADGQAYPVRIRRRDEKTDLALLQIMAKDNSFEPVQWSSDILPKEGGWMVSADPKLKGLKVGVNSGTPRAIKREGGVIGVILGRDGNATGGIAIAEVVPRAAGATAGLKKGDVITKVNGKSVKRREQVIELVGSHDPGDVVSIEVIRDERSFSYQVTLGHRSVTFEMFNRNLQMSGPVSKRKDNFPMIIQHDLPLPPEAMGGPVLDINGKAVGLNMARVDRVTTYALTAKIVQDTFKTLNR
jgi:serine protease Do